jgi:hypothetical protein
VWEVKILSSVLSASRVDASVWDGGECGSQCSERAFVWVLEP